MKKVIITIGVLGLLYSCDSNEHTCTNEINKLNNTILELENNIEILEDSIWMINYLSDSDNDIDCGPQNK